jgi:hypothetical protein
MAAQWRIQDFLWSPQCVGSVLAVFWASAFGTTVPEFINADDYENFSMRLNLSSLQIKGTKQQRMRISDGVAVMLLFAALNTVAFMACSITQTVRILRAGKKLFEHEIKWHFDLLVVQIFVTTFFLEDICMRFS